MNNDKNNIRYKIELINLIYADIDTSIDFDYDILFNKNGTKTKIEDKGISLKRQKPFPGSRKGK